MALTTSQYDTILKEYSRRQLATMRLMEERKEEIYEKIPAYREIDNRIASVSVEQCKKKLMGDSSALDNLSETIEELTTRKKLLLTDAGYSINYLEPVYVCPDCKDTGYCGEERCHCFKQAMLDFLYEQSNIRQELENTDFRRIRYDYQNGEDLERFKKAVAVSRDFVNRFEDIYQNLFFYGTVGTGKTMLSNCIAKEIIATGHSCIYFSAVSLFEHLSEYIFQKKGRGAGVNPYEELYDCDLLIIDDLGTELANNFVATQLFSLLNERHLRQKSTIISSNLTLEELRDTYSDRIFSRIISNYQACKLSGTDVRIEIKRSEIRK